MLGATAGLPSSAQRVQDSTAGQASSGTRQSSCVDALAGR